jgi:hypothetical protein
LRTRRGFGRAGTGAVNTPLSILEDWMGQIRMIDGVPHVWSIFDNQWVTLEYWNWVNGR